MRHYFGLKVITIASLIVLLFCGTSFIFLLPKLKTEFLNRNKETLRTSVQVALRLISSYQRQAEQGVLTLAEAKEQALNDIRNYRYGKNNLGYFWINSMDGTMLMHPYREDLINTPPRELTDNNAKTLLLKVVDMIRQNDSGYMQYLWQWRDDPSRVIEKISYVKAFDEWKWIIGTGFYLDDVEKELEEIIRQSLLTLVTILVGIVFLLLILVYKAVRANNNYRRSMHLLEQSEKRFWELAELLPEGVFECDLNLCVTYANNRAQQMFGYDQTDLERGINCLEVFDPGQREQVRDIFRQKMSGINTGANEYIVTRKDGSTFPALLHSNCIYRHGKPSGLRGVIIDISEFKEIERQLIHHRDNLEHHVAERTRELEAALREVKLLSGLLPICAHCKNIRDDKGFWKKVETYIEQHSEASFSHSICPDCAELLYGKEQWFNKLKSDESMRKPPPIHTPTKE